MDPDQSPDRAPDDDLDLADVQRDQILDELRAIRFQTRRSRLTRGLLVSLLVAVLWSAAEAHDSNCYARGQLAKLIQVSDGQDFPTYAVEGDCTLLPWNHDIED